MSRNLPIVTVIVLVKNESLHLSRLIRSFDADPSRFVIVDSGSTDGTAELARQLGADVYAHPFENHARQFNWALETIPVDTPWIMRMDGDEYLLPELAAEMARVLPASDREVSGWFIRRRVYFWDHWIRHGGYYPTWLLRIWRTGRGCLEDRAMNEHVVLKGGGSILRMKHDLVDNNLKGLGFWIDKHNGYSDREVLDFLYRPEGDAPPGQAGLRRRLKLSIYMRAPVFFRAWLYWIYRYFIRLGFLDGLPGMVFHFLQGFWYWFLVDAKLYEQRLKERRKRFPRAGQDPG